MNYKITIIFLIIFYNKCQHSSLWDVSLVHFRGFGDSQFFFSDSHGSQ